MPLRWLLTLALLQAAALVLILRLPLSWTWTALLLALWLAAGVRNLRLYASRRLVRAVWREEDDWRLWFADGRECAARLAPQYFHRGPWLQLRLRLEQGSALPLLIVPGMLAEGSLRRLKVRLRLFAGN